MDQQTVQHKHGAPDLLDHHQTIPEQQVELEQQTILEQEPTSYQGVPRDQQTPPTPESNEEALRQHQRNLRSYNPSGDLSEMSYHTEHTGFPGSRHSSINTEPLTLDADQIHEAKDQAVEVIQTADPEEAFDVFTKELRTKSEEALPQESEGKALSGQINTLVEQAQQVVEANEQEQSRKVNTTPGGESDLTIEDGNGPENVSGFLDTKPKAD